MTRGCRKTTQIDDVSNQTIKVDTCEHHTFSPRSITTGSRFGRKTHTLKKKIPVNAGGVAEVNQLAVYYKDKKMVFFLL